MFSYDNYKYDENFPDYIGQFSGIRNVANVHCTKLWITEFIPELDVYIVFADSKICMRHVTWSSSPCHSTGGIQEVVRSVRWNNTGGLEYLCFLPVYFFRSTLVCCTVVLVLCRLAYNHEFRLLYHTPYCDKCKWNSVRRSQSAPIFCFLILPSC